jgi:transcriptional regulator with XRE-family HTH domain
MYGQTIRRLRKQRNMTQSELADLLGVGQSAVANMETGLVQFSAVDQLRRIADILGVPLSEIVDAPDAETPAESADVAA